jgi:hypothetical protein
MFHQDSSVAGICECSDIYLGFIKAGHLLISQINISYSDKGLCHKISQAVSQLNS